MSIDLGLENIWKTWRNFRKGKRSTTELYHFQYHLEKNLFKLRDDLNAGSYIHGAYRKFIVCENKKREISVAQISDRVVHRLIYDYLNTIYDKSFQYDVWSCRKGKGLAACIERTQKLLRRYLGSYIWRSDIKKFFDNVDHGTLMRIISRKIKDPKALNLITEIVYSFHSSSGRNKGIPIGNLTSQIFANIYLNELDFFVKTKIKPLGYLRYGDDFIVIAATQKELSTIFSLTRAFLVKKLGMELNMKNNFFLRPKHGLKFLGVKIWPNSKYLLKRNVKKITSRVSLNNISSYRDMALKYGNKDLVRIIDWLMVSCP